MGDSAQHGGGANLANLPDGWLCDQMGCVGRLTGQTSTIIDDGCAAALVQIAMNDTIWRHHSILVVITLHVYLEMQSNLCSTACSQ